jgi:hypothetical protein
MMKIAKQVVRDLTLMIVLGVSLSALAGCRFFPESTFQLAKESRLPKWITLPSGLTRADVSVTMSYYISPGARRAEFILQDAKKGKTLAKTVGSQKCGEPFQLKNPPPGFDPGYPAYEAITVNGATEIIEHRKMEPVFYITDDPDVQKQIDAASCDLLGKYR